MNPERNYVLSLIKRDGEAGEDALGRVYDNWLDATEIQHGTLRRMLIFVQDNAARDLATSARVVAQYLDMDQSWLDEQIVEVDHTAVGLYTELLTEQLATSTLHQIGEKLQEGGVSSEQMLNELQAEISHIKLAQEKERIITADQNQREFMTWVYQQQEFIKSGKQRIAFPRELPRLDEMIPYLFPGNVILVTAKTKVGKSSFAQAWLDDECKRGFRCVYCHFEDTPVMMGLRRLARENGWNGYHPTTGEHIGPDITKLLTGVMSDEELKFAELQTERISEWTPRATQIYCADWEMKQVARVVRRMHMQEPIDFLVIDYLNKAHVNSQDIRYLGIFEARARDAEIVKVLTEELGCITVLVQQEGDEGLPFQTRQAAQKSQVHISLQRERLPSGALDLFGSIVVMNANLGSTGSVASEFNARWMLWLTHQPASDGIGG